MGITSSLKKAWKQTTNAVSSVTRTIERTVKSVAKKIETTVKNIVKDPIPFIAMVAGAMVGIPPYVTAAAITASRGGNLSDVAKSAAVAYIASEAATSSGLGQSVRGATSSVGSDFTQTLITDYGFSASTAGMIGTATTAGLNSSIIGGVRAAFTGQDIGAGMVSGFTSGAIYSTTDSYFKDLQKDPDWGLSPSTTKQISNVTSSALNALVSGKDPSAAIANYISYTMMKTANDKVSAVAKETYQEMKDKFSSAEEAQKTLEQRQADYNKQFSDLGLESRSDDYNNKVSAYQNKIDTQWAPVQAKLDEQKTVYDTAFDNYTAQEKIYNDTSQSVDVRDAAADKMSAYAQQTIDASKAYDEVFNANKGLYDEIKAGGDSLRATKTTLDSDFETLQKNAGAQVLEAKNSFEQLVDEYKASKAASEEASKAYEARIADAVTRDVTIDAINNKLINPAKTNEDGSVTLENGMTIRADGSIYQGDQELFTNADGVEQNDLKFTTDQNKNFWVGKDGSRLSSDTDIQDLYKINYGVDVSADEAKKFAGQTYSLEGNDQFRDFAIDKIGSEFEKYGYKAPDDETLASYIDKGGNSFAKADAAIDPYYVDTEEAKNFIKNTLNREATPEEIAMLVGAKNESESLGAKSAQEAQMYNALVNLFGAANDQQRIFDYGDATRYDVAGEGGAGGTGRVQSIWGRDDNGNIVEKIPDGKGGYTIDPMSIYIFGNKEPQEGAPTGNYYDLEFDEESKQLAPIPVAKPKKTESEQYNEYFLKDFIDSMTGGAPSPSSPSGPTAPSSSTAPTTPTLLDLPPSFGVGATGVGSGTTTSGGALTNVGTGAGAGTGATSGTGTGTATGTGSGTGAGTGTGTGGTGTGTGGTGTGTGGTPTSGGGFGDLTSYMTGALTLGSQFPSASSTSTPLKPSVLTSKDTGTKFEGVLDKFQEFASKPFYDENTYADQFVNPQPPQQETPFMNTPYYNYGELDSIDQILNPQTEEQPVQYAAQGGLMATPLMAAGGMTGTRHGQYAQGGLSTPIVHHSGKARVDFRQGDAVTGAGDGQSDDIPAMLADGEFVFPADVVSAIGNGSTKAGSDKLYDMMHGIRAHARSSKPKDLPPEIKSPLAFLKTKPSKARS